MFLLFFATAASVGQINTQSICACQSQSGCNNNCNRKTFISPSELTLDAQLNEIRASPIISISFNEEGDYAFKMSTFKDLDVVFISGDKKKIINIILSVDNEEPEMYKNTRLSFTDVKLTLKNTTSEAKSLSLLMKTLHFIDTSIVLNPSTIKAEMTVKRLNISQSLIPLFDSITITGGSYPDIALCLDSDAEVNIKKESIQINGKEIAIPISQPNIIFNSIDPSNNLKLSSEQTSTASVFINGSMTVDADNFKQDSIYFDAEKGDIAISTKLTTIPWSFKANKLNITLSKPETTFNGLFDVLMLYLSSSISDTTKVQFNKFNGNVYLQNSNLDVYMESLTIPSKDSYPYSGIGLVFSIDNSQISRLTIKDGFKKLGSYSSYNTLYLKSLLDKTPTDSELSQLFGDGITFFKVEKNSQFTNLPSISFVDSTFIHGFYTDANCLSLKSKEEPIYQLSISAVSPSTIPMKIIFDSSIGFSQAVYVTNPEDFSNMSKLLPQNIKTVNIELKQQLDLINFSTCDSTQKDMSVYIKGSSSVSISVYAKSENIHNLTLSSIGINEIDANVTYVQCDSTIVFNNLEKISFGKSTVKLDGKLVKKIVNIAFAELVLDITNDFKYMNFYDNGWGIQTSDYSFDNSNISKSNVGKLTIITDTNPKEFVLYSEKPLGFVLNITRKQFDFKLSKKWVTSEPPDEKINIYWIGELDIFLPDVMSFDSFTLQGPGTHTINYIYGNKMSICSYFESDSECSGSYTKKIGYEHLSSEIEKYRFREINITIMNSNIDNHSLIETRVLETNIVSFISDGSGFIELDNSTIKHLSVTILKFINIKLIATSNLDLGSVIFYGSSFDIPSISALNLECSYDNYINFPTVEANNITLTEKYASNEKTIDFNGKIINLCILDSDGIQIGNDNIIIGKLTIQSNEINMYSMTQKVKFVTVGNPTAMPIIKINNNLKIRNEVEYDLVGPWNTIQSGLINYTEIESGLVFDLYEITPISTWNCSKTVIVAKSNTVGFKYLYHLKMASNEKMNTSISDSSVNIKLEGGIGAKTVSSSYPLLNISSSNIIVHISSIWEQSDKELKIFFNYKFDENGCSSVIIDKTNGFPFNNKINIDFDTSVFIDEQRTLLTYEDLTNFVFPISFVVKSITGRFPHGISKFTFSYDIQINGNKLQIYKARDINELPYTIVYSSYSSSATNFDIWIKDEKGLEDLPSLLPETCKSVYFTTSSSLSTSINFTTITDLYISGYSKSTTISVVLNDMKKLSVEKCTLTLIDGSDLSIGSLNFTNCEVKSINYTLVQSINSTISDLNLCEIPRFDSLINLSYGNGDSIEFNNDGWTITDKLYKAIDFPQIQMTATSSLKFNIISDIQEFHKLKMNISYIRCSITLSEGWEQIKNTYHIDSIPNCEISIRSSSFSHPFVFDETYSLSIQPPSNNNLTIPTEYKFVDFNAEFYVGYGYFGLGNNASFKGNNKITVSSNSAQIVIEDIDILDDSSLSIQRTTIRGTTTLMPGSTLSGNLSSYRFEYHWDLNKFPSLNFDLPVAPPNVVSIVFDGNDIENKFEDFNNMVGKVIPIAPVVDCGEWLLATTFEITPNTEHDPNKIFDSKCLDGKFSIVASRMMQVDSQTSEKHDIEQFTTIHHNISPANTPRPEPVEKPITGTIESGYVVADDTIKISGDTKLVGKDDQGNEMPVLIPELNITEDSYVYARNLTLSDNLEIQTGSKLISLSDGVITLKEDDKVNISFISVNENIPSIDLGLLGENYTMKPKTFNINANLEDISDAQIEKEFGNGKILVTGRTLNCISWNSKTQLNIKIRENSPYTMTTECVRKASSKLLANYPEEVSLMLFAVKDESTTTKNDNVALIVGVFAAVIVVIIILVLVLYFVNKRKKDQSSASDDTNEGYLASDVAENF